MQLIDAKNKFRRIKDHRCSGSLTLEASILVPLFLFFMVTMLSLIDMLYFYERVEQNLHQSAREMAIYAPAAELIADESEEWEIGSVSTILADQYAKNNLLSGLTPQDIRSSGIIGGSGGFNFVNSRIMTQGDLIDLVVSYELEPRNNFFFIPCYPVLNRCRMKAWTGYDISADSENSSGERMVYITETGTVFHLTETCTYLALSIQPVTAGELALFRNQSGGIYDSCEICGGEAEVYYITDYGDRYHTSLSCSGLKRTIMEIPISQAGDRHACSRCGTSSGW